MQEVSKRNLLEENWKGKKGRRGKRGQGKREKKEEAKKRNRKAEKGADISLRGIGRNSLRKLSKLASFCCRHEWSPREIENYLSNLKYFVAPEPKKKFSC